MKLLGVFLFQSYILTLDVHWVAVRGYDMQCLRWLLLLLLAFQTASAVIIPSNRVAAWEPGVTVGVPGGIPTGWSQFCDASVSIPGTNIVADPTETVDSSGAIWAALALCPSNQVVYLPQGRYRMDTRLQVGNTFGLPWINNRILRGHSARATNTTLVFRISNSSHHGLTFGSGRIADAGQFQNGTAAVALSSDLPTGSTSVTLSSLPADIFPGSIIWFDELNDGTFVTSLGSGTALGVAPTAYDRPRNGTRNRASYHRVESVSGNNIIGNTVTFSPPIPLGFTVAQSAVAIGSMSTRSGAAYGCNIGIENINFEQHSTATMGSLLRYNSVTGCWVKDCRFNKAKSRAIQPSNAVRCEFTGNDFIKAGAYTVNAGYGMECTHIGGCLIENNAVDEWYISCILENSSYNVIAYNAFFWGHSTVTGTQISDSSTHAAFCCFNLWEGNKAQRFALDFYYGTSGLNTFFRNHLSGNDTNITDNRICLSIDAYNQSNNVVGNVMSDPTLFWYSAVTTYDFANTSNLVMRLGYPEIGNNRWPSGGGLNNGTQDSSVTNTIILTGNRYRNESSAWETYWHPNIADHTIPTSLFRSTKPAYFGTLTWPPFGPDVTGYTNEIPPTVRLLNLTMPNPPGPSIGVRRFGF